MPMEQPKIGVMYTVMLYNLTKHGHARSYFKNINKIPKVIKYKLNSLPGLIAGRLGYLPDFPDEWRLGYKYHTNRPTKRPGRPISK